MGIPAMARDADDRRHFAGGPWATSFHAVSVRHQHGPRRAGERRGRSLFFFVFNVLAT